MEVSKEYSIGLKNGYFLRKTHPVLTKSLLSEARGRSDYLEGLKAGSQEFERESAKYLEEIKQQKSEVKKKRMGSGYELMVNGKANVYK